MSSAHLHSASLHVGREHSLYDKKRAELSFYASITLFSALFLSHCSLFYAQKKHETGFEPAALALARRCSTTEPLVHFLFQGLFDSSYLQNHTLNIHLFTLQTTLDLLDKPSTD